MSAWVELYQKRDGRWFRVGNVSNFREAPVAGLWTEPRTGMAFVQVPAGRFVMGSPASEPHRQDQEVPHQATITSPFLLGQFEVTQEQWRGFRADSARCAARYTHRPQDRGFSLGFRVVREAGPR